MKFRETGSENGLLKGLSYSVTTCKQDLYIHKFDSSLGKKDNKRAAKRDAKLRQHF